MVKHKKKRGKHFDRIIDVHTHILPGIDDGVRDLEEAVQTVQWLAKQGVTDIVATPHYIAETEYSSPKTANAKLLRKLKTRLKSEGTKIEIFLGNEIYIDDGIKKLIKNKKIAPINDSKYLLVEMSLNDETPNYEDYFYDLIENGYRVVLAHPERYITFQKDFEKVRRLHEMGVLLQCNTGSIIGKYGRRAKKTTKKLAKNKMIFVLGSDAHRPGKKTYLPKAWRRLRRYYSFEELVVILELNPAEMLKKVTKRKTTKRKTTKKTAKKTAKKTVKKATKQVTKKAVTKKAVTKKTTKKTTTKKATKKSTKK